MALRENEVDLLKKAADAGGVQNGPLGAGGEEGGEVVELKARVAELQVPRVEAPGFTGVPCS